MLHLQKNKQSADLILFFFFPKPEILRPAYFLKLDVSLNLSISDVTKRLLFTLHVPRPERFWNLS